MLAAESSSIPVECALDGLGVRVQQQLVGVASRARRRIVGAVHPVAVALTGFDVGHEGVPDEAVDLGQREAGLPEVSGAVVVEQA
jgi:hypothetical protein